MEVQSEPTAESMALFADISSDFDHRVGIAGAQSCLDLLVVCAAHCQTRVGTFYLSMNIVDILSVSKSIWT